MKVTVLFENDLALLELNVVRLSANQVRIRITDPVFPRYEVTDMPVRRQEENADEKEDLQVHLIHGRSEWRSYVVIRGKYCLTQHLQSRRRKMVLALSGLIFENKFIEISTQLTCNEDPNPILYGLGERIGLAHLRADDEGDLYPIWRMAKKAMHMPHRL
ncbi:hypothetical protein PsorP6_004606 [Peronosclerospora sorghi]|uniref:Uncharacterized protein n=1 Tax=Peronosclerospora sorghi TaxID=230839 RepID=A0ACC0VMR2_9STRA|nr:hypothetical protein PsorP6_004606 [Peronosclerospora sorghi]